jgi:predicted permease
MLAFVEDLRPAVRLLARRPGLTVTTALTLGLGIGLTTTMFSVVNGSIWRGLPVERSDRVVHVERTFAGVAPADPAATVHDFLDWRGQQGACVGLGAFRIGDVNVSGSTGAPARYGAAFVTANLFDLLGVAPAIGRGFREEDEAPGAPSVAIVSDAVWRDHLAGRASLEGSTLRLDGESVSVVGVMPPRFRFPLREDVWMLLRLDPAASARGDGPGVEVIGRLNDGATRRQAQAELGAIAERLARDYPATNRGVGVIVRPFAVRFLGEPVVTLFYVMLASAGAVLLIACVNVMNLLLAAASLRTREMAMRAALGASRMRLVGQASIETCILSALGAVVGVVLARVGIQLFNAGIAGTNPPFWVNIQLDAAALAFVLGLVAIVALATGLYPSIRISGAGVAEALRDESRGATGWRIGRFSRTLVVMQIALTAALLVAAGALTRTMLNVGRLDFGINEDRVLVGGVILPARAYPDEMRMRQFWDQLLTRISQQPGVRSAALCTMPPGLGSGRMAVAVDGVAYASPAERPVVRAVRISPRFFETFDVTMFEGREFGNADRPAAQPTVIVNRKFASRFLPGGRAIGRRIRLPGADGEIAATIVGVAPDLRMGVNDRDPEVVYLPVAQWPSGALSLAVRTVGDPRGAIAPVRAAVATLDPDLPVSRVLTMAEALESATWFYGTFGRIFVVFGLAGLALALVGLYGLMAISVSQREREFGVRLAVGARPADVLGMVFRQALLQVGAGLAAGLTLGAYATPLLQTFLIDVDARDPAIYALVAAALGATGLLAVVRPALRAARTSPTDALRAE